MITCMINARPKRVGAERATESISERNPTNNYRHAQSENSRGTIKTKTFNFSYNTTLHNFDTKDSR